MKVRFIEHADEICIECRNFYRHCTHDSNGQIVKCYSGFCTKPGLEKCELRSVCGHFEPRGKNEYEISYISPPDMIIY